MTPAERQGRAARRLLSRPLGARAGEFTVEGASSESAAGSTVAVARALLARHRPEPSDGARRPPGDSRG